MGNDLQKTLDFYKKRVEELEKNVVEINKSKFDKLMEKDILFHLKKELEEKDKENKRLLKNWKNSKSQQTRLYEKLKQQLAEKDKEIEILKKKVKASYIDGLLQKQFDKDMEIEQLKEQLHTQPKEIVEKIKGFMDENTYYHEEERFAEYVAEYLDKILKEYEEE